MSLKDNTITLKMLDDAGACEQQMDKFRELFGERAVVDLRNIEKCHQVFSWAFAARAFLPAEIAEQVCWAMQQVDWVLAQATMNSGSSSLQVTRAVRAGLFFGGWLKAHNEVQANKYLRGQDDTEQTAA